MSLIDTVRANLRAKLDERSKLQSTLDETIATAEARGEDLTEAEAKKFAEARDAVVALDTDIEGLTVRVSELEDIAKRNDAAAKAVASLGDTSPTPAPSVRVGSEPRTYNPEGRDSYFRDLAASATNRADMKTLERLERHGKENEVEARDLSRTDTAGGVFVPPAWLMELTAGLPREGRVTADLFTKLALPAGTDSVNIPRITTGTKVEIQTADNAALTEQDMVTTSVAAAVGTIGGVEDAAIQLLEQSPLAGGLDRLIFADLLADYDRKLDLQVLAGTGANGQAYGIENTAGVGSTADATTTAAVFYGSINAALSTLYGARFAAADAIVMHPRRWHWLLNQKDTAGRPLVTPRDGSGVNVMAQGDIADEAVSVGTMLGVPVYVDPNIGILYGTGTDEDRVYVGRFADHVLMESTPRMEVFRQSQTGSSDLLGVRFRLYNYVALTAGRFPASTNIVKGAGLATPVWA